MVRNSTLRSPDVLTPGPDRTSQDKKKSNVPGVVDVESSHQPLDQKPGDEEKAAREQRRSAADSGNATTL